MNEDKSKTKVVNLREEEYDVYIGRGEQGERNMFNTNPKNAGWLGNPFTLQVYGREKSIERFKEEFYHKLEEDEEFKKAVESLKGKTLGCFCKPKPCHGDVIVEYLEDGSDEE